MVLDLVLDLLLTDITDGLDVLMTGSVRFADSES